MYVCVLVYACECRLLRRSEEESIPNTYMPVQNCLQLQLQDPVCMWYTYIHPYM